MASHPAPSMARQTRRTHIAEAARALVGCTLPEGFDAVRSDLCAIDVVMVAGSPWLKDGMERDFARDEAGYRKIGGGANSPRQQYFFRSKANLIHYVDGAIKTAEATNTRVLDLHRLSMQHFNDIGIEKSTSYNPREGDTTHLNAPGANAIAGIIIEGLRLETLLKND